MISSDVKIAIYTCITGDYDDVKIPTVVQDNIDYIIFTDNPDLVKKPWVYKNMPDLHMSNKDKNRYVKMHPGQLLPEYDITVYIDGTINIVDNITPLLHTVMQNDEDIFVYRHPQRQCVYEEVAACMYYAHITFWDAIRNIRRYKNLKIPRSIGLYEAGVIFSKKTYNRDYLFNSWWGEFCKYAKRDQLHLPVVACILGIKIGELGISDFRTHRSYFDFIDHKRKISIKANIIKYINRAVIRFVPYHILFNLQDPIIWHHAGRL